MGNPDPVTLDMSKTSPTQRSLKKLRDEGFTVAIVEHWNPFAHIRQDLYGFIDLVAMQDLLKSGLLGVQTTSATNFATRIKKSMAIPALKLWLKTGNRFVVHGWKKTVKGWECKERYINLDEL